MKYLPIDPAMFVGNRERFCKHILPNSLAIFNSSDELPRNGDQTYRFRQNSDLFYLSGIDQEQSILVIYPDCPIEKYREALFLRETNERIAVWEGHKYTKEEARAASGIKNIFWLDSFETALREMMANTEHVYLNTNENIRDANEVPYRDLRFIHKLQKRYPLHDYKRSAPVMTALRTIKQPVELDLIREAIRITGLGFKRLLGFVRPGVMEYEVQAELEHEFIRNRADGHGFAPIIASGASACCLHYDENNKECRDGDLLLLDIGAEYANYSADLTRTIPVNGKFSPRQKECYNAIARIMKAGIEMLVPGTTIDAFHAKICKLMEEEHIRLGLYTREDVNNQDPDKPMFFKYYPHGTSHYMGLDVHDLGFKQTVIRPGMVFTCEPGIYILEEGIGIRIENDILITENGNIDLMADIPYELEQIEALMAR